MNQPSEIQLETAAKFNDLDSAVGFVQNIIGQTDGGIAAQFFDQIELEQWPEKTKFARVNLLREYIEFEFGFCDSESEFCRCGKLLNRCDC